MSWEEELINLYDKNSSQAGIIYYKYYIKGGKEKRTPYTLLPVFHTNVTAQIQITVSAEGEFIGASRVEKEDNYTIIPVTEKSLGARTSGPAPHPLCDNLKYLAADFIKYVKKETRDIEEYHKLYMEQLEKWNASSFSHEKVYAICKYVKKETIIQDLVREKVLVLDEEGHFDDNAKIERVDQEKAFVRFIVRKDGGSKAGQSCDECWKDLSLQKCYIQYYSSLEREMEMDYITGDMQMPSYRHPKYICNEGADAKLVSSNDDKNFTFRGHFKSKEQAFSVGYVTSQKMHNALKWIVRKQGKSFGSLTLVTWESDMQRMPLWVEDTDTISSMVFEDDELDILEGKALDPFQEDVSDAWEDTQEETEMFDGNSITAKQFYSALEGYKSRVENTSHMILMAFDAATKGRLSLTEFKTLDTIRYLDNIKKWHEQCGWIQWKYKDGQRKSYYGVPGVWDIANILYGEESKGKLELIGENEKRFYAELCHRLLPCIWDGKDMPYDLVMTAVNRATMPQRYKEWYNWECVLSVACSFVKKQRYEKKKEEWDVALDRECDIRDYLYGRLLAVADKIEYSTFDKNNDSSRLTNAKRYMSTFSQRPFETWKLIEENLQPYLNKLSIATRQYYENELDSILRLFTVEKFSDNSKLDGLYLLAFHSQSYELKYSKNRTSSGGAENE